MEGKNTYMKKYIKVIGRYKLSPDLFQCGSVKIKGTMQTDVPKQTSAKSRLLTTLASHTQFCKCYVLAQLLLHNIHQQAVFPCKTDQGRGCEMFAMGRVSHEGTKDSGGGEDSVGKIAKEVREWRQWHRGG